MNLDWDAEGTAKTYSAKMAMGPGQGRILFAVLLDPIDFGPRSVEEHTWTTEVMGY